MQHHGQWLRQSRWQAFDGSDNGNGDEDGAKDMAACATTGERGMMVAMGHGLCVCLTFWLDLSLTFSRNTKIIPKPTEELQSKASTIIINSLTAVDAVSALTLWTLITIKYTITEFFSTRLAKTRQTWPSGSNNVAVWTQLITTLTPCTRTRSKERIRSSPTKTKNNKHYRNLPTKPAI
jgi:hypothetical protein